jgi:hypothetical protein
LIDTLIKLFALSHKQYAGRERTPAGGFTVVIATRVALPGNAVIGRIVDPFLEEPRQIEHMHLGRT